VELGGPLAQFGGDPAGGDGGFGFFLFDGTHVGTGATASEVFHGVSPFLLVIDYPDMR
jgi:hypothetical protein